MSIVNLVGQTTSFSWLVNETTLRRFGIAGFLGAALLVSFVATSPEPTAEGRQRFADFEDATYYSVKAYLSGENPYDSHEYRRDYPVGQSFAGYGPHFLLLHLPLGFFSARTAAVVWMLVSMLLLVLSADLALRIAAVKKRSVWRWPLAAAALLSWPGGLHVISGQTSIESIYGALLAFGSTSLGAQAVGVALACLKPQFGLPLVVFLLTAKRFRAVSLGLLLVAILSGIVLLRIAPAEGFQGWTHTALQGLAEENATEFSRLGAAGNCRIDLAATVARVTSSSPSTFVQWLLLLGAIAVPSVIRRIERPAAPRDWNRTPAWVSLCMVTVLLATPHQTYDALLLVLPIAVLCSQSTPPWARIAFSLTVLLPQVVLGLGRDFALRPIGTTGFSTVLVAKALAWAVLVTFLIQLAVIVQQRFDVTHLADGTEQS